MTRGHKRGMIGHRGVRVLVPGGGSVSAWGVGVLAPACRSVGDCK